LWSKDQARDALPVSSNEEWPLPAAWWTIDWSADQRRDRTDPSRQVEARPVFQGGN